MKVSPAYDAPSRIVFDGDLSAIAVPVARQRRRFERLLHDLEDAQWRAESRCAGWAVRDVVAHLVTVNRFWSVSVRAGIEGAPTRYLEHFDPVAVPRSMVESMQQLTLREVFDQFAASNTELLDAFAGLHGGDWSIPAESPVGHVPMWSLAHHALWDSWVHERDITVPLGLVQSVEADEVAASLRYAAVIGAALVSGSASDVSGTFAVSATDPDTSFTVTIGDGITVRDDSPGNDTPCLRGGAVLLVDALSIRAALPADSPREWQTLTNALATVFDQPRV